MKILVVIDVQNDFVDGRLGTKEAIELKTLTEKLFIQWILMMITT